MLFRRILSRTFAADPFLHMCFQEFIYAKESFLQKIEHSPILKRWYEEAQANIPHSERPLASTLSNFSAAKHRFSSHIRPLGRLVLSIVPMIHTAKQVVATRRAEPGTGHLEAKNFLAALTTEKYLQLCMMADAAEETNHLLRFVDAENVDIAVISSYITDFQARIHVLFRLGQCTHILECYTGYGLSVLSRTHSWQLGARSSHLGSPSGDVLAACLRRMVVWCTLADDVIKTEFPSFELFACFNLFDLARGDIADPPGGERVGGKAPSCLQDHSASNRCLWIGGTDPVQEDQWFRRLAQCFDVECHNLRPQFAACVGLAQQLKQTQHRNNGGAWAEAVQRVEASKRDVTSLKRVLQHYAGYGISTCTLERKFSRCDYIARTQCHGPEEDLQLLIRLKLTTNYKEDEEALVVERARRAWAQLHGMPRRGPRQRRSDFGCRRKDAGVDGKKKNERQWLRHRATSVGEAVQRQVLRASSQSPTSADMSSVDAGLAAAWGQTHQKEATFQRNKRLNIKAEWYKAGALLPEEIDNEVMVEAARQEQCRRARDQKAARARMRVEAAGSKASLAEALATMQPRALFVDETLPLPQPTLDKLASAGLTVTSCRARSGGLVATDPCHPGRRTLWTAICTGYPIIGRDGLGILSPTTGSMRSFVRAFNVQRQILFCNSVQNSQFHVLTVQLLQASKTKKWRLLENNEEFCALKVANAKRKKPASTVAVGNAEEGKLLQRSLLAKLEEEDMLNPSADTSSLQPAKHHIFTVPTSEAVLR